MHVHVNQLLLQASMMDVRWHYIGRLQKQNAKKVVGKNIE